MKNMDCKYAYKFTQKAETDLDDILRYIGEELSNPSAAATFARKLFEAIDNVRNFPLSAMLLDNEFLSDKNVRRVVVDNYVMYYTVRQSEQTVYIVRIVYGKRNLEEIYRSLNV